MMKFNALRKWSAASPSVVKDWISESESINTDLRAQSKALRARARDLEQNSDYVAKYLQLVEVNVIGEHGIRLQAKTRTSRGKLDGRNNRIIEREFRKWSKASSCSVDGRLSWLDLQRLVARSIARDGEILIRLVRANGLQLIAYEADYLNNDLNMDRSKNQNQIAQGIELDALGKPIAYHLAKSHPGPSSSLFTSTPRIEYERVPADDILHIYRTDRPGQIRGASWIAPAMIHLLMLDRYIRAEMLASEFSAKKVGYYKTPTGDWLENDDDATSSNYGLPTEIQGLGMQELPAGVEMDLLNPAHPNSGMKDYLRTVLSSIATGLGVSYHSLSGDLTQVNFSSIRSGTLEERDRWRSVQRWLIDSLHQPVFDAWLAENIGLLGATPADVDRMNRVMWQPRGWTWVDPVKDIQAHTLAYNLGITSLSDIAATQGRDLEDVFDSIAKDAELAEQYGIKITTEGVILDDAQDNQDG